MNTLAQRLAQRIEAFCAALSTQGWLYTILIRL